MLWRDICFQSVWSCISRLLSWCCEIYAKTLALWFYRQHFLQCPQGLLNKHFEKLIQCDTRLCFLSRQPEIVLESPCFEPRSSAFEDPESKDHGFDPLGNGNGSSVSGFQDVASPSASQSSSLKIDQQDTASMALEHQSREAPSPSSGIMNELGINF